MCSNGGFEGPKPFEDVFYLNREQLRVVSHPTRRQILGLLCLREMSATELKREIEDAPKNLHYHVDRLRDAGLIRLVRTEQKRGATEKYYRSVASAYSLAPELVAVVPTDRSLDDDLSSAVRHMLEDSYRELTRSLQAGLFGEGSRTPVITGLKLRTTPKRAAELRRTLVDWLRACRDANQADGEVEYVLLSLMFPTELPEGETSA